MSCFSQCYIQTHTTFLLFLLLALLVLTASFGLMVIYLANHDGYLVISHLHIVDFVVPEQQAEMNTINVDRDWAICNRKAEETTREIYNSWKEELEKLLIFAGLFSAIVATFTVESVKDVLGDPADETVLLLRMLVFHANNLSNPQANLPINIVPDPPITPCAEFINLLYSVSLVLSLAAVLGGILCLQWLREFSRNITGVPHEKDLYLQHRRHESLRRWGVLWMLNALPLLLLVALALFFVGFSVAQWEARTLAAIPVTIIVAISILFIIITSILPGLQLILLAKYQKSEFKVVGSKPAATLCPYRSPQAWLAHSMLRAMILPIKLLPSDISLSTGRLKPFRSIHSWTEYDTWWTGIHNTPTSIIPALLRISTEFRQSQGVVPAAYKCLLLAMTDAFASVLKDINPAEMLELSLFYASVLNKFHKECNIDASRSICDARLVAFVKLWEGQRQYLSPSGRNNLILPNVFAELLPARDSKVLLYAVHAALEDSTSTIFNDGSASATICYLIDRSYFYVKHGNEELFTEIISIIKVFIQRYLQADVKSTAPIQLICLKVRQSLEEHYHTRCNDTSLRIFNSVVQDLDPIIWQEFETPLMGLLSSVDVDDISKDNANAFIGIVEDLAVGAGKPSKNPIVTHAVHVIKHLRYPDADMVDVRLIQALENEIYGTPRDSVISPLPLPTPAMTSPKSPYSELNCSLSKLTQAITNRHRVPHNDDPPFSSFVHQEPPEEINAQLGDGIDMRPLKIRVNKHEQP